MSLLADTAPLRTPDFRRLWLSGVVTVIGPNLTIFAVPVQIYALTQSSAYVGLAGVFALVPLVGVRAVGRRVGRRDGPARPADHRVVRIGGGVGAAVGGGGAGAQQRLAGAVLAVGAAGVLRDQRSDSLGGDPAHVASDQLPAANSLNMTVTQFGAIVGPLLAGVMLRWVDLSTLYLIDAITCVAPIWATIRLSSLASVWDGFRYLAGNTVVLMSFVVDLIAMIFGMPRALFPQIAHESFGGPVEGGTTMALLAAAISAGAVAGGVFSGWLPRIRRHGLVVVAAIVVWGLAMVGFGLCSGIAGGRAGAVLWASLAFLAVGGAADMVSAAFRSTILQQAASDDVRGRLQGTGGRRGADRRRGGAGVRPIPGFGRRNQLADLDNQLESAGYDPVRGGGRRGGDSRPA